MFPGRYKLFAAWAGASLLAGCLLVTAGCAGGASPSTAGSSATTGRSGAVTLIGAAARATLAGAAGVEFELRGARAFGPSSAPVLGSGEFDFAAGRGVEKIDLGESGGREPGNEQALFLPQRVYLQPKGVSGAVLARGKEWVAATLSGSDAIDANFPSFVLQAEAVNPQLALVELAGGTLAATPAESATVDGAPARRYVATIDLARALESLRGPGAAVLARAIQTELASPNPGGAERAGQTEIAVWLDGKGHVVQLQSSPPGAGAGTATMTLCCFGLPVRVSPPPAALVVDLAALTPSGERENNGGGDSDGG